jgi:hypothetical protein
LVATSHGFGRQTAHAADTGSDAEAVIIKSRKRDSLQKWRLF